MTRDSQLADIKGVGINLVQKFNHLGLKSINDLIYYFPKNYDDFSVVAKVRALRPGKVTTTVQIKSVAERYGRRGTHITEALASDDSGSIRLTWFNQPYRQTSLKSDTDYFVTGKYELRYGRFAIYNPVIEAVSDFPINTARIVPRYGLTKGLTSADVRRALARIKDVITQTGEDLPDEIIQKYQLMSHAEALLTIHFPSNAEELERARRRLAFEELFMMILASELNKQAYEHSSAVEISFDQKLAQQFVKKLPFELTNDQRKAIWQIYKDIAAKKPMNRLVEGDVGSGKTAVAAMAALMAINSGKQVVFMAPTELLARQHAETVNLMYRAVGLDSKVGLLIGAMSGKAKNEVHLAIKSKELMLVIGTHALIQDKVKMADLALVIIDEQHRFGVKQRQALKLKAGVQPHLLSLSATPIPRSLALTLFGELYISRLIEKPTNRQPVATKIVTESVLERQLVSLKQELRSGRQMFIVAPSIDSQEKSSVEERYHWAANKFAGFKVSLVHGRLSSQQKSQVMEDFARHKIDILVATTVIEVGIDVPNASIMLIFDAENFGLAQLHQLRGRVGRGQHSAQALLVQADNNLPSDRLRALESTNDGFKLAELDLNLRGPGAIYGQLQHGMLDLKVAGLDDRQLIRQAREAAVFFVESKLNLLEYKDLAAEVSALQKLTNLN